MTVSSAGGDHDDRASNRCLSLLVTRDEHAGHVFELAEAARNKGVLLMVHLTGSGVRICCRKNFGRLHRICRLAVCRESAEAHDLPSLIFDEHPGLLITNADLVKSFLTCRQRLVF